MDITHSFVETDMNSSLDTAGLEIKPDNILCGIGGIAEKNSSFGMEGELGRAFARGAYPDTATKGAEIGEIVLVLGATRDGRVVGALNGERIVNAKIQIESIRPELASEGTTKEHGAKGIANGLM